MATQRYRATSAGDPLADIHRLLVLIGAWAGSAATVGWLAAAVLFDVSGGLVEIVGPAVFGTVSAWMLARGRLRGDIILGLAATHLVITVAIGRRDETLLAAALGLIVILAAGVLLVPERRRLVYVAASGIAAFCVGLLWGREDAIYLSTTMGVVTVVGVGLFSLMSTASRRSELRYRTLFEGVPVALALQDWREVRRKLDELTDAGVDDLVTYLDDHPDELERLVTAVRVVDVNDAFVRLIGAPDRSVLVGPWGNSRLDDHSRDYFLSLFDAMRKGATSGEREWESSDYDGKPLWLHLEWLQLPPGTLPDADRLVAANDITALKLVERELSEMLDAKDQLVASISHELRTPLTAVIGFAELLAAGTVPGEQQDEVRALLLGEARDMADIIEDLLVAARARLGAITIKTEHVDLSEIAATASRTAACRFSSSHDEPVLANADATRVAQILRNLIANSIRYGGSDRRITFGEDEATVWVEVRDDGPGVPPELVANVFDPYVSGMERVGLAPSMGLGLWVSRALAELMNGSLVYERDESDTVFRLTLPRP